MTVSRSLSPTPTSLVVSRNSEEVSYTHTPNSHTGNDSPSWEGLCKGRSNCPSTAAHSRPGCFIIRQMPCLYAAPLNRPILHRVAAQYMRWEILSSSTAARLRSDSLLIHYHRAKCHVYTHPNRPIQPQMVAQYIRRVTFWSNFARFRGMRSVY